MDRIPGLEMGANEHLVKPFNPRDLLVRANVVMRRALLRNTTQALNP